MRVIRHESGWDIALDMVFTDKQTAAIIANRIQHAVHALVCDAVDSSMCGRKGAKDASEEGVPATIAGQPSEARQPQQGAENPDRKSSPRRNADAHLSTIAQTATRQTANVA